MSPGAEEDTQHTGNPSDATVADQSPDGSTADDDPHHHHVLLEAEEDRWRWRRRIRQNPRQLVVYRLAVAILGLLLICLGFVSGPLPGPGGIPLILLGLAVWASEFEWAHHLMERLKSLGRRYQSWSRQRKSTFWLAFFSCSAALGYGYLLVLGLPGWLPAAVSGLLQRLPGV
jgi:uncharacterized protein (TIGR02611 family)